MTVSILLAVYKGEAFLRPQLESLSAQTFSDFAVLWQDDGSEDRTPEILSEYGKRDRRFRAGAEQGKHLGAAANFLSLLRQSEGDYLLFCDQDDIWEKEKVETLLKACRQAESEHPGQPVLVHSDASIIDQDGRETAPSFFRLQGWDPGAVHLNQLLVQNNATGCMMLLNRPLASLIIQHGNPEKMFMHDWFIALTAAAFGQVVFVDIPLTRYRQHGHNVIGASHSSLLQRGLRALSQRKAARERIALTYSHTRAFREAFGESLPPEARRLTECYLETQSMGKLRRIITVYRLGCRMQNPVTRFGQILFG